LTVLSFRSQEKISVGEASGSQFLAGQSVSRPTTNNMNERRTTNLLLLNNLPLTPVPKSINRALHARNGDNEMQQPNHMLHIPKSSHVIMNSQDAIIFPPILKHVEVLSEAYITHDIEGKEYRPAGGVDGLAFALGELCYEQINLGLYAWLIAC
jgi:hypothetical protein